MCTHYDSPHRRRDPPHSPPPPHGPQEACSHNDGERCKGGSDARRQDDRTDARFRLPSYIKRGLHTSCGQRGGEGEGVETERSRGRQQSERRERGEGGCECLRLLLTAPRTPSRHRSRPGSRGGKVRDPPPVKSSSRGIKPARVRGHVAGPGGAYMASGPRRRRSRT